MPYTIKEIELASNETTIGEISQNNVHYFVLNGNCNIVTTYNNDQMNVPLSEHRSYDISKNVYVQLANKSETNCTILEVKFD